MTLPSHILAQMAWLSDPENREADNYAIAAACLSDELRDWSFNPEGYVPREVLVDRLAKLRNDISSGREVYPGRRMKEVWFNPDVVDDLTSLLAGQCPAWFVLADWGRMTEGERDAAQAWVMAEFSRIPVTVSDVQVRTYDETVHISQHEAESAELRRLDWLARELQTAGHVPEGWRLEWTETMGSDGELYVQAHYCQPESPGEWLRYDPLTFTREHFNQQHWRPPEARETVSTYVGRCEQCHTVYATRPTVAISVYAHG